MSASGLNWNVGCRKHLSSSNTGSTYETGGAGGHFPVARFLPNDLETCKLVVNAQ